MIDKMAHDNHEHHQDSKKLNMILSFIRRGNLIHFKYTVRNSTFEPVKIKMIKISNVKLIKVHKNKSTKFGSIS